MQNYIPHLKSLVDNNLCLTFIFIFRRKKFKYIIFILRIIKWYYVEESVHRKFEFFKNRRWKKTKLGTFCEYLQLAYRYCWSNRKFHLLGAGGKNLYRLAASFFFFSNIEFHKMSQLLHEIYSISNIVFLQRDTIMGKRNIKDFLHVGYSALLLYRYCLPTMRKLW